MKGNRTVAVLCLAVLALAMATGAWAQAKSAMPTTVFLKHTEPRAVAKMSHKGPYTDMHAVIEKLMKGVDAGDHHMVGPVMAIHYNSPQQVSPEELLWEIWIPVAYPGVIKDAEDDMMGFRYMDPQFVAYTYHIGPYDKVGDSYKMLFEWAERNKYEIQSYPVELYWSDPAKTPAEKIVTELWLPVKERKIPGGVVR